ncbi:hypothetical protein [Tissierella sp.]|uniref:hypothetical protein n=1 Tax=Tissierella sp. TaxID=41274 RepID=UPI002858F80B|nr:hypothetical protein [Tissierella sp.]MDR7855012.1 hypothetical protein [Tissierella sp.]
MLQVISKKFFESEDFFVTEREIKIYSNINSESIIQSPIASMEPLEIDNEGITTYLLKYDNVIEKQRSTGFQLIAIGDNQIIGDYLSCLSFWFKGLFSTEKNVIKSLIRTKEERIYESHLPRKIVPSIFKENIKVSKKEIDMFNEFIASLIGLPRETYLLTIKVIRQFFDALTTINYNLELSYTMFVASIESLAQKFDNYKTKWEDCPKSLTVPLENIYKEMEENTVNEIKKAIINEIHVQLSSRYRGFALYHITESYYRDEAIDIGNPCKESQLLEAIRNSYDLRSKYVHTLNEIPKIIKTGGESEIYNNGKNIYFTFPGLIRFTRHIILEFIRRQEQIEKEKVNYFAQLPNSIEVNLAPEYWLHKVDNFNLKTVWRYLEGFLNYYVDFIKSDNKDYINLFSICNKIESIIKGLAKDEQKVPFVVLYILYNLPLKNDIRCSGFDKFAEKYETVLEVPCIENVIYHLLTGNEFPWTFDTTLKIYEKYEKRRRKNNQIKVPGILEVCLLLEIANLSIKENDMDIYYKMVLKALHEHPGDKFLLDIVNNVEGKEEIQIINWEDNYFKDN